MIMDYKDYLIQDAFKLIEKEISTNPHIRMAVWIVVFAEIISKECAISCASTGDFEEILSIMREEFAEHRTSIEAGKDQAG